MPLLRMKEIRDMSDEDRNQRLSDYKTELLRMKTMIGAGGTVENPARIKILHRAIARILTVEHEEKHGIRKAEPKKTGTKKPQTKKAEPKKRKTK